jgi:hypothetical protein
MKQITFNGTIGEQKFFLRRVDKRKARNLFNRGLEIYLVPSNLRPYNNWFQPTEASLNNCFNFDQLVNNYTYYNCINSETGYFASFYINTLKP